MSQAHSDSADRSSVFDHPIGFWFFFWGELAERCCYYGMRAVLLLYMIQILKFSDGGANCVISYFIAACYLAPLIGGYVADKFLGKYRTIVYFAVPYIFGQAMLAVASLHNTTCLFFSLGLLAMGSGVIKPNISTLMGQTYDQVRPGRTKLRSDAFAMYYGSINIGAALSSFCVPWIRNAYGSDSHAYALAFLFPTALMILAFIVFAAGKPFYATETISRTRLTPAERRERMVVMRRLFGLFFVVVIFWSIFDQSSSTWILLARDHLQLNILGFQLSPDQLQTLNPVLIIILLPPVTMLWHLLARFGLDLRPTDKMLIGFVLTTITMGITAWAAFRGADVMVTGASTAVAAGEKLARAAETAVVDKAIDYAVMRLTVASAANRIAEETLADPLQRARAVADAKGALATARKVAQNTDPAMVATAAAQAAATTAIHLANTASEVADSKAGTADRKLIEDARKSVIAVEAAAEAINEAIKLATEGAEDIASAGGQKSAVDLAVCAMAANRATAAAAAARRSAEAAAVGNIRAARINAAVAGVDAADAAIAAAQASLKVRDIQSSPVTAKAERNPNGIQSAIAATENATDAARISILWQVIPYILLTMAEICISVVGLELAFSAAPATMKSFVTACWLLTVFFGDIILAQITPLYNETFWGVSLTPDWYFLMFALLMIPVTVAFSIVARRFNQPAV